jgi:predicted TIM-barrel fold metal-dependent hydrolase
MEVDVAEGDMERETAFVSELDRRVTGVIAPCRPEAPDFPAYIERIAAQPKLRGLRRVLHVQPDATAQAPIFAENLRRLAAHHLTFDFCVQAGQLPIAIDLARQCPGVRFVLDHCGNPNVKAREREPWRSRIRELAALVNVACKISGIVTNADPERWTADDLRPYVEHVIECFGWDRVVWGSDWPVCTMATDLSRWMEATQEIVSGASESERARLMGGNAQRIYRL